MLWAILLTAQIAKEENLFDVKDVLDEVREKIKRRHPHVFAGEKFDSVEEIFERQKEIKEQEKLEKKKKK